MWVGCGECASVTAVQLADRSRGLAMDGPARFERIGNQRNDNHCDQDQFDHKVFHERPPNEYVQHSACAGTSEESDTAT